MKKYYVEITETLQKVVEVEAESESDAVRKAKDEYNLAVDPEYVLDSSNYVDTEFQIVDPNNDNDQLRIDAVSFTGK